MIEQHEKASSWTRPSFEEELGEFERTANHLDISLDALKEVFRHGKLSPLDHDDWIRMENCDSSDPSWTLEEAREHLREKRDFERIEQGLREGREIPAPIVLYRKGHEPYLISGSSRLLGCRVLGLEPVVFKLELNQ